jgi:hypothetical protein
MNLTMTATTMMKMYLTVIVLLCLLGSDYANLLRGNSNMEALKERVLHPTLLPKEYRGKTWADLGVDVDAANQHREQRQRKTQSTGLPTFGQPTYSYFAVSKSFGNRVLPSYGTTPKIFSQLFLVSSLLLSCSKSLDLSSQLWETQPALEALFSIRTLG